MMDGEKEMTRAPLPPLRRLVLLSNKKNASKGRFENNITPC
jgi:hypothetical protein